LEKNDGLVKSRCHPKHRFGHMLKTFGLQENKRTKKAFAVQNRSLKWFNRALWSPSGPFFTGVPARIAAITVAARKMFKPNAFSVAQ